MSKETLATLKRGYEAFNRGDTSELRELAREIGTPDVEWGATGAFPGVDGMYRGPEAMPKWMDVIRSAWEEFEVSLDEVLHDGDDVVVVAELLRGRGRGSGVEVEMRIFSAYWFEEGKIRRRAAFTEPKRPSKPPGLRSRRCRRRTSRSFGSYTRPTCEATPKLSSICSIRGFHADLSERVFNPGFYEGHDGYRRFLEEIDEVWDDFRAEPLEFIDAGDKVVVSHVVRGRGKGSGVEVELPSTSITRSETGS